MGDVQVAFGILIHCFVQRPSYFLQCTPPFSTFIESLTSFDFSLFQMFGRFLGSRSFDNLEGPLACKQASLSITFDVIRLISTTTIALVAYLKNWALVASIIAVRFMVDQRLSFLKS